MPDLAPRSFATSLVERVLRIPSEPAAPAGAHGAVQVFHAAPGFFRYRMAAWILSHVFAAAGLTFGVVFLHALPEFPFKWVVNIFETLAVLFFLATLPFTFMMVRVDYLLRWYIVTDRSLRIREGIMSIDEKTMSFANIQNVSIRQGPVQRLFGISDVEVRTAGGGGATDPTKHKPGGDMHLGYFRGVENAEEIRDAVLARVRTLRDSGLGDPDHDHHAGLAPTTAVSGEALAAARELLEEARSLRAGLGAR